MSIIQNSVPRLSSFAGYRGLNSVIDGPEAEYAKAFAGDITADNFYFLPESACRQASVEKYDVYAVRLDFPALRQTVNGHRLVWLDNAATTQKPFSVIDTVANYYSSCNSNVHRGAHTLAKISTECYEGARKKVQEFIGAGSTEEIIFTRGATESVNLVAQSYGRLNVGPGDEIIVSMLEHHSNLVPWQLLCEEKHAQLKAIPLNAAGEIILEEYEKLLSPKTRLVAVAHVSNALGTVLPVKEIIAMAHRYNIPVLVDGAQGIPHFKVDVNDLDADFYTFSGHKLFGPTGIGVLYGKKSLLEAMPPWQSGGNMIDKVTLSRTTFNCLPAKFEAGTGHIAGAAGLGAAIDYLNRLGLDQIERHESLLMSYATAKLQDIPRIKLIGTAKNKAGILSFVIPDVPPEKIGSMLDLEGIAVRAGHHCAQPALAHFGLTSTVRPSLALYNTLEDIDRLVFALRRL